MNTNWLVGDRIGILDGDNPAESPDALKQLEREGFVQVVTVRPWPFTMAWRLPECNLRNFMVRVAQPDDVSPRLLSQLNEFCVYELVHGRRVPLWFEDDGVRDVVVKSIVRFFAPGLADLAHFLAQAMATQRERLARLPTEPARPTGCIYCRDGLCRTNLVCHATSIESALAIVEGGQILSACKARGVSSQEMAQDPRNAAGDPPDYFEYVMWGPGNCTAVDKLVLERTIGRVPSWEEFEAAFQPAARFFFRGDDLHVHPRFTNDGIHGKIRDGIELAPYLILMVVPEGLAGSVELTELGRRRLPAGKTVSFPFANLHYRDWAHMAYQEAMARSQGTA